MPHLLEVKYIRSADAEKFSRRACLSYLSARLRQSLKMIFLHICKTFFVPLRCYNNGEAL